MYLPGHRDVNSAYVGYRRFEAVPGRCEDHGALAGMLRQNTHCGSRQAREEEVCDP